METRTSMAFGMRCATHSILKELNNDNQKNLVLSPLLLHAALNLLASSSTGRTCQQLLRFLESESTTDLNAQTSRFMELISSGVEGSPIISLVNGIWVDNRFSLKPSFIKLAEDVYKAKAETHDKVLDKINSWTKERSDGKIDPFLSRDSFTKDIIAVLASALYFNGKCETRFYDFRTAEEDFHLLDGQTIRVPFMKDRPSSHLYESFDGFKLLKMNYKKGLNGKEYAMYIFLPDEKDGIKELVQKLHADPEFFTRNREVSLTFLGKVWLLKLKYEYEMNATGTMKELGLDLPFDDTKAEITEMIETSEVVYVSDAIQKSYIEVNEEGTVATSLFNVVFGGGYAPSFVADHPFIFVIKEDVTGIILFLGASLNPLK